MSWHGDLSAQVREDFREVQRNKGAATWSIDPKPAQTAVRRDTKHGNSAHIDVDDSSQSCPASSTRVRRIVGGRA